MKSVPKSMTAIHQFAESLGNAVDAKDAYTEKHSLEVAEISRILALSLLVWKQTCGYYSYSRTSSRHRKNRRTGLYSEQTRQIE